MFGSEVVTPKSEYLQQCLVESLRGIPEQKSSFFIPSSVPQQGIGVVLLSSCHIPPCLRLAEIVSCQPCPGAMRSCALQAQHRQKSTCSSFSDGRPAHCSLILPCGIAAPLLHLWWPSPTDRKGRKYDSCVAPQVIGHCRVAKTAAGVKGDRDTWTQLEALSLKFDAHRNCVWDTTRTKPGAREVSCSQRAC